MNTEQENEVVIDIPALLFRFRKNIVWIILVSLAGALVAGAVTTFMIDPTYDSYTTLYVYNTADQQSTNAVKVTNADLQASAMLAETYKVVLDSNTVLNSVSGKIYANTGSSLSPAALRKMVDVSVVSDTQVVKVIVTSTDPALAMSIANAFAEVAPNEIVRVTKAGGVEVVDYAELPVSPSGPNLKRNIAIGFVLGLALIIGIIIIRMLTDTVIIDDEDIDARIGITVIGSIPEIQQPKMKDDVIVYSIKDKGEISI